LVGRGVEVGWALCYASTICVVIESCIGGRWASGETGLVASEAERGRRACRNAGQGGGVGEVVSGWQPGTL
jgi:hypothetical protein